jgi:hypothetical protein
MAATAPFVMTAQLACMLFAALVCAQTTAPVAAPIDPTTPKGALKSFAQALESGDRKAVLDLLKADSPQEQKVASATADLAEATALLRRAAIKAFGEKAARPLGADSGATTQAMARIDASSVALDGDRARITASAGDEPPLSMVRHEQTWRVPVSEIARDVDPASLEKNLADVAEQARLLKEIASEVESGKFTSATDARQELDRRILKFALPPVAPASTTRPAAASEVVR